MNQKKSLTQNDAKSRGSEIVPVAKFFILILAILVVTFFQAKAQTKAVVNQSIQWTSFNSNVKLNKKFGLTLDGQFRFAQYNSMQNQLRIGFEYYVTKSLSIIPVHYSYIWNYIYGEQPAAYANDEHRIGQQIMYKHKISRVFINHRLRTEERFIQIHTKNTNDVVVNDGFTNKQFRVRYRALVNVPINHATMAPKTFYVSAWGEIFTSRGELVKYHKIDQGRVFVGPGYQINKDFAVQAGFIAQTLIKANGTKQENNTGLMIQVNYNFDLTKKNAQ